MRNSISALLISGAAMGAAAAPITRKRVAAAAWGRPSAAKGDGEAFEFGRLADENLFEDIDAMRFLDGHMSMSMPMDEPVNRNNDLPTGGSSSSTSSGTPSSSNTGTDSGSSTTSSNEPSGSTGGSPATGGTDTTADTGNTGTLSGTGNTESGTPTSNGSGAGATNALSKECPSGNSGTVKELAFKYKAETKANNDHFVRKMESKMFDAVKSELLSCGGSARKLRKLSVTAIDASKPADHISSETCTPSADGANFCSIVDAGFTLTFESSADELAALNLIKTKMASGDFLQGLSNVVRVTYLENGEVESPPSSTKSTDSSGLDQGAQIGFIVGAILGVALVTFIIARSRRQKQPTTEEGKFVGDEEASHATAVSDEM